MHIPTSFPATAVLAACLACASAAAPAQDLETNSIALLPSADGSMLSGSFTAAVSGLFLDAYSFTPADLSGTVSVTLTSTGPVTFLAALLGGDAFMAPGEGTSSWSFSGIARTGEPLSLALLGFAGSLDDLSAAAGTYTVAVNAAAAPVPAIPEPGTYALMLGGLALLAAVGQRRRRQAPCLQAGVDA